MSAQSQVTVDISQALEVVQKMAHKLGGGLEYAWAGNAVSNEIAAVWRDMFKGQNKWQPLSHTTMMARSRRVGYYSRTPATSGVGTLVWTGTLRESLGNPRGAGKGNSYMRFTPRELEQGTTLPYAAKHDLGIGVPRRSLTDLTAEHEKRIGNAFTAFILGATTSASAVRA